MDPQIYTPEKAEEMGYIPLTYPYKIDSLRPHVRKIQKAWYASIKKDLEKTDTILVDTDEGREFWRHKDEMDTIREENSHYRSILPYGRK